MSSGGSGGGSVRSGWLCCPVNARVSEKRSAVLTEIIGTPFHNRPAVYNPFMPTVERFAPGEFCWIELATSDQNAAKSFYGALFGWAVRDIPTGPDQVYSLLELQGRVAAGAFAISAGESAAGIPPHWHF